MKNVCLIIIIFVSTLLKADVDQIWHTAILGRIVTSATNDITFGIHNAKIAETAICAVQGQGCFVAMKNVDRDAVDVIAKNPRLFADFQYLKKSDLFSMASGGGGFLELSIIIDGIPIIFKKRISLLKIDSPEVKQLVAKLLKNLEYATVGTRASDDVDVIKRICGFLPSYRIIGDGKRLELILLSPGAGSIDQITQEQAKIISEIDVSALVQYQVQSLDMERLVKRIKSMRCKIIALEDMADFLIDQGVNAERMQRTTKRLNLLALEPELFISEPTDQPVEPEKRSN